jgi:hypothetical protein
MDIRWTPVVYKGLAYLLGLGGLALVGAVHHPSAARAASSGARPRLAVPAGAQPLLAPRTGVGAAALALSGTAPAAQLHLVCTGSGPAATVTAGTTTVTAPCDAATHTFGVRTTTPTIAVAAAPTQHWDVMVTTP